jgi:hypothetical protein
MGALDLILLTKGMAKPLINGGLKLINAAVADPLSTLVALHDVVKKPEEMEEKPPYTIPEYSSGMKRCDSKDPYLRATPTVQSDAPEIIALANSLGAYQKSDWDYANAAFEWVRDHIAFGLSTELSALGVLKLGRSHCMGKMSLLAALCRCGGLSCRIKVDMIGVEERTIDLMGTDLSQEERTFYDALSEVISSAFPHNLLEVKIDGKWVPADPVFEPELACALGYPIATFGEDPSSLGFAATSSGEFYYIESYPRLFTASFKFVLMLVPGLCHTVNDSLKKAAQQGKQILEQAGGIEAYNSRLRNTYEEKSRELGSIMGRLMGE